MSFNFADIRPEGHESFRRCSVTVMDTSDPDIQFSPNGESSWVKYFREDVLKRWSPDGNLEEFSKLIKSIKAVGQSRRYDCAIGVSGGLDSSYLVYLAMKEGLRPLLFHTDAGWNTEMAVRNIEKIVATTGFDLYTNVINWDALSRLQVAFLNAGVPNQDIPQDHVIFASLYKTVRKLGIPVVLSGHNEASESIMPNAWGYDAMDSYHIKAIARRFDAGSLRGLPLISKVEYGLRYKLSSRIKIAKPLNLTRYERQLAIETLKDVFKWEDYGGKHYESRWTRFYQGWWLPTKFGFDKRKAHLSSLILSNQITREAAINELTSNHYPLEQRAQDAELVRRKLKLTDSDWDRLMLRAPTRHTDYPNSAKTTRLLLNSRDFLRRLGIAK